MTTTTLRSTQMDFDDLTLSACDSSDYNTGKSEVDLGSSESTQISDTRLKFPDAIVESGDLDDMLDWMRIFSFFDNTEGRRARIVRVAARQGRMPPPSRTHRRRRTPV